MNDLLKEGVRRILVPSHGSQTSSSSGSFSNTTCLDNTELVEETRNLRGFLSTRVAGERRSRKGGGHRNTAMICDY